MSDYYPNDEKATPALIIRALAEHREGAPYTAAEIADLISEDLPVGGELPEQAVSRRAAYLYEKHAVDRRKRDAPQKPYEYWLAGHGRFIAQKEGWLPEPDGPEDLRENPGPDALLEQVGEAEESDEQVVEDQEGLNAALHGLASTLKDHEETLEDLRGSAVMADEVEDLREEVDAVTGEAAHLDELEDLREYVDDLADEMGGQTAERVESLQEQVNALGQAIQREQEGETDEFARAIRSLRRLERDGYYVHEIVRSEEYGGKVAEVRVKAKKGDEKDRRIAEADADAENEAEADGPE